MEERDKSRLDDYFNGLLPPEEQAAVEARAAAEAEFGQEFALRQKMEAWLHAEPGRQVFKQALQDIGAEYFRENAATAAARPQPTLRVQWGRRLLLAAASLALLAVVWWLLAPKPSLYRQYAYAAPLQLTDRGETNARRAEAEAAFNRGDYTRAAERLAALRQETPDDLVVILYEAVCLIELQRPAEARTLLAPVAAGRSALREEARWWMALSYLAENNREACRKELEQMPAEGAREKEAQGLLKKLQAE